MNIYTYIHVHEYTYINKRIRKFTYVYILIYIYTCIPIDMYTSIHLYLYTNIHTYLYIHIHIHINVYTIHIHIYICMGIPYIRIRIHTYTDISNLESRSQHLSMWTPFPRVEASLLQRWPMKLRARCKRTKGQLAWTGNLCQVCDWPTQRAIQMIGCRLCENFVESFCVLFVSNACMIHVGKHVHLCVFHTRLSLTGL